MKKRTQSHGDGGSGSGNESSRSAKRRRRTHTQSAPMAPPAAALIAAGAAVTGSSGDDEKLSIEPQENASLEEQRMTAASQLTLSPETLRQILKKDEDEEDSTAAAQQRVNTLLRAGSSVGEVEAAASGATIDRNSDWAENGRKQQNFVTPLIAFPDVSEPVLRFLRPVEVRAFLVAIGPQENVDYVYEHLCLRHLSAARLWHLVMKLREWRASKGLGSEEPLSVGVASLRPPHRVLTGKSVRPELAAKPSGSASSLMSVSMGEERIGTNIFRDLYYRKLHRRYCEECGVLIPEVRRQRMLRSPPQTLYFCEKCEGKLLESSVVSEKLDLIKRCWPTLKLMEEVTEDFKSPLCHASLYVSSPAWSSLVSKFNSTSRGLMAQLREDFTRRLFEDFGLGFCKKLLPRVFPPTEEKEANTPRRFALARTTIRRIRGPYDTWKATDDVNEFLRATNELYEGLKDFHLVHTHRRAGVGMLIVAEFLFCRQHDAGQIFCQYPRLMREVLYRPNGTPRPFLGDFFDRQRVERIFNPWVSGMRQDDLFGPFDDEDSSKEPRSFSGFAGQLPEAPAAGNEASQQAPPTKVSLVLNKIQRLLAVTQKNKSSFL